MRGQAIPNQVFRHTPPTPSPRSSTQARRVVRNDAAGFSVGVRRRLGPTKDQGPAPRHPHAWGVCGDEPGPVSFSPATYSLLRSTFGFTSIVN